MFGIIQNYQEWHFVRSSFHIYRQFVECQTLRPVSYILTFWKQIELTFYCMVPIWCPGKRNLEFFLKKQIWISGKKGAVPSPPGKAAGLLWKPFPEDTVTSALPALTLQGSLGGQVWKLVEDRRETANKWAHYHTSNPHLTCVIREDREMENVSHI